MDEQTQVERVARAILATQEHEDWSQYLTWEQFEDEARAAIAAMPPQAPTVAEAAQVLLGVSRKETNDACMFLTTVNDFRGVLEALTTPKGD